VTSHSTHERGERVASPGRTFVARAIATAGGAGYVPVAPGTAGTAVAVPLVWALSGLGWPAFLAITIAVTAIGIAAASEADRSWGTHDSGRIVIDEVAGYMVTMLPVARGDWWMLGVGFVLFRLLDQVKPPPARAIDEKMGGGAGVVLDDIAAGVWGAVIMWGLAHWGVLDRLPR
jgi:phosphatidylglycerophosphatase A